MLVKLFGITPNGLNASSEGEIRVFYDEIAAFQENNLQLVQLPL
ncbi:anti-CBASS protein Acb1 family protein [Bombella intestini]|nr:anti-CBASS Acb1 family protein [Bombella intestini]